MPAALIQPDFDFIKEWGAKKGRNIPSDPKEMVKNEAVIKRIQKEIDFYNERFGKWEKVKKFELTPEVWSIEGGQLTPTMKMKRKVIKEKYKDLYDKIYEHSGE